MAINVNSEQWYKDESEDQLRVKIQEFLRDNEDYAFSIREIDDHLLENHSFLFPDSLTDESAVEGAEAARHSILAIVLAIMDRHEEVRPKFFTSGSDVEPGVYYTYTGNGIHPIAEIDDVGDPDPDSSWMTLASRFRHLEQKHREDLSELEGRISKVEYQTNR